MCYMKTKSRRFQIQFPGLKEVLKKLRFRDGLYG